MLISGFALYALPIIAWVKKEFIIRWIDPIDPVPQGAMFYWGIGFLASCVLALSLGSLLIVLGLRLSIRVRSATESETKSA